MPPYTKPAAIINLGPAPEVPTLRWSLVERLDKSRRAVARPVPPEVIERRRERFRRRGSKREPSLHPGRGRRHRREVRTRQLLALLAGQLAERGCEARVNLHGHTIHELLYAPIPDAPSWALALRMQGRELLSLAKQHGPASGWGMPQPTEESETSSKWTPYYIPKRSERCWRWWRLVVLFLMRVLTTLAAAWWRLIPLHRQRLEGATAEKRGEVLLAPPLTEPSRCRDQSPSGVGAILGRMMPGLGM